MRKYLIVLFSVMTFVYIAGCSNEEEKKTTDELKEDIKESEEELQELYKEAGSKSDNNEENVEEKEEKESNSNQEENQEENDDVLEDDEIDVPNFETDINAIVADDMNATEVTNVEINEDASVDEERYIVLVDLEWDVKNSASTTKDMLDMYSDHLAAKLADDELIYNLVLFWTVPYHNEDDSILKRTYENKDDGMYLDDEVKDISVFD